jgi:peptidoglycan/LPS O-acetylase OafA/YrhL
MGVQVLLFILAYSLVFEIVRFYHGSMRRDIGYGILLQYAFYLFGVLASVNSVIQTSAWSLRAKVAAAMVCAGIFGCYLLPSFSSIPYRASLLLLIGAACLFVPLAAKRLAPAKTQPNNLSEIYPTSAWPT